MSHPRIILLVASMVGLLVSLAIEDARIVVGLPSLIMMAGAAGLFERQS